MSTEEEEEEVKSAGIDTSELGSWIQMAQNPAVKPEDFFSRLSSYWNMCIATGGMLSGFAFVVASQQITFKYDGDVTNMVFSICIVSALMFGLSSTFVGLILYGYLNVCGPIFSKWFVRRYRAMPDVPLILLFASIFFILLAVCAAVRGFYGNIVFFIGIGEAICVMIGCFTVFWKVGTTANVRIIAYTAEMQKLKEQKENEKVTEAAEEMAETIQDNIQKNKTFYR
eukprot:194173_1